jgi:hypothetical protein
MKTFTIALLAGVGALAAASGAKAADLYTTSEYTSPDLIQEVRLVCDDAGNCYRTRGGAGIRAPGVSVGVGVGGGRW